MRPSLSIAIPVLLGAAVSPAAPGARAAGPADAPAGDASGAAADPVEAADDATGREGLPRFFATYCFACHGERVQERDLRFDRIPLDFSDPPAAARWIEVRDRLRQGEMPPEDAARHPREEEVDRAIAWIERRIEGSQPTNEARAPRRRLRRLTRAEYTNTVQDLLHYRFLPSESPLQRLPQDGRAHGFHKVAEALPLDPSLLQSYYEIAAHVARETLVEGPPEYPTERTRFEYEDTRTSRAIDYQIARPSFLLRDGHIVLMEGGARAYHELDYPGTDTMVPVEGWYTVRVRAAARPGEDGRPIAMWVERPKTRFRREVVVGTGPDRFETYEWRVPMTPRGGNVVKAGIVDGTEFYGYNRDHSDYRNAIREAGKKQQYREVLLTRARQWAEGASGGGLPREETIDRSELPRLLLDYVEIEGPVYESWPPEAHQELFPQGTGSADPESIRPGLRRFMKRAYRRPVTGDEVAIVEAVVRDELDHGASVVEALRAGIAAVLVSPQFLYLSGPSADGRLTDWQIASRLSYFLWSTMPDAELFRLAEAGELGRPEILEAQVDRMLEAPKARALVNGFGAQWLKTRAFLRFRPDEELYPEYGDALGADMVREAEAFFARVLFQDKSVLDFIDSDWTVLNERLAEFYGIEGVEGEAFRPVELPDASPRGGVLTMAGVALWGSDGTRTKPIERAKYVRDVLFNDPPDPPPGNVGELEPAVEGDDLTVRERLARHRSLDECMKCHRNLDPYGMALENFNAIGRWRDRQDGEAYASRPVPERPEIDASGTLPGGTRYDGPAEFKKALLEQEERFLRGLVEKVMVYALGRPVEPSDDAWVGELVRRMRRNDYTFRSLIRGLVTSPVFLGR